MSDDQTQPTIPADKDHLHVPSKPPVPNPQAYMLYISDHKCLNCGTTWKHSTVHLTNEQGSLWGGTPSYCDKTLEIKYQYYDGRVVTHPGCYHCLDVRVNVFATARRYKAPVVATYTLNNPTPIKVTAKRKDKPKIHLTIEQMLKE